MHANNPLIGIGLNPSTADDQKPDQTISRMLGFAERNGFDGFIMFNLYPKRTPYPDRLPKRIDRSLAEENHRRIEQQLQNYPNAKLLAAWGSIIEVRPYLKRELTVIKSISDQFDLDWLQIGSPTLSGHPRHPSRAAYSMGLNEFDIEAYLKKLEAGD
jgi:hypothetical protein